MAFRLPAVVFVSTILSFSAVHAQTFAPVQALSFIKPFAGANPLPQILTVTSTGANFGYSISVNTQSGGNWLQVSPQGYGCCSTPTAITVSINAPVDLAAATYQGSITLTSYPDALVTRTIPVALIVVPAGGTHLDNLPGQLSFSLKPGGTPPAQLLNIRKVGAGVLNWSAQLSTTSGSGWLNMSATSGAAPGIVSVSIDPSSLPGGGGTPGIFTGRIRIAGSTGGATTIPVSVAVGNAVLSQINPISFVMPFGGTNPLPQIITATSTGSPVAFSMGAATAKGGNWLQVGPAGYGCCSTPSVHTVSVTAPSGLPVGTYTGQITLYEYSSQTMAITVPVTLTVAPPASTFFDNIQGHLSFSIKTGGKVNAQTVYVRNGGSGTLSWSVGRSTSDGGNWLTVSNSSDNAPSELTVSILRQALPGSGLVPGTFTGQLVFRGSGMAVTVPISVVVGDSVFQQIGHLSFTMQRGAANPLPQLLSLVSTGSNLQFSVYSNTSRGGNWLQVTPAGYGCCSTPDTIEASISATTLAAGTYTGQITFVRYSDGQMSMTVPVTLTVVPAASPSFDNLPGQLSFLMRTGGSTQDQTIQIRKKGSGTLSWSAVTTTALGGAWLKISSPSGSAPSDLEVSVAPGLLPGGGQVPGTFAAMLRLESPGQSVSIPVAFTVGDSVFQQINPISFNMGFAGPNPLPKTLTIASTGSPFSFSIYPKTANGGNWLQVSPAGFGCCSTPRSVTVSITAPAGMAPGVYTGQIEFVRYSDRAVTMTVPVTLTVSGAAVPRFDSMPSKLSFFLPASGPPAPQTMQVRNAGGGTLSWTASRTTTDGGNWLNITPAAGTAPSVVSVSITRAALPGNGLIPGNFVGQIVFESPSGRESVEVTVSSDGFQQINPLSFVMPFGGANPLPQMVTAASNGTPFSFSSAVTTSRGGQWLELSPAGFGCCSTPRVLSVGVNASTLPVGVYTGEVTLTSYSDATFAMTIPVTLTIVPPASSYFDNLPGQLSFFMKTGGSSPAQAIQIRNGGAGALSFTAARSTADRGNWLRVPVPEETAAPSMVNVSVTPADLPGGGNVAGTFTGQVVLQTATGSVTIPVSVVVGDYIFSQINPISFTMPFGGANPLPQTLTLPATGSYFGFSLWSFTSKGGAWLQAGPAGFGCCALSQAVTVSINAPPGLAVGAYTGQLTFVQYSDATMAMTVPVTLTVVPANGVFFDNTPGQLTFSQTPGGNTAPQAIQIRSGGTGNLAWTATRSTSDNSNWLSAGPLDGTAPSTLGVNINKAALPGAGQIPGTFTGEVVLQAAGRRVTVPVVTRVDGTIFNQPQPLSFTMRTGGPNPQPQNLSITSAGSSISFSVAPQTGKGGNWLQVSPSGYGCCSTPRTLSVSVVPPANLAPGAYTAQISIVQYSDRTQTMNVPVYLTVTP